MLVAFAASETGRLGAYWPTHQQDSSQPQQPHSSPHLTGLGLMMEILEEVEPGMLVML